MLRSALLLGLFIVSAFAEIERPVSYHAEIGIPEAERIKAAEQLAASRQERIVGGSLAPQNEHPYFAGLLINLIGTISQSVCGATLLSANRLVTAAHCWYDGTWQATQFTVVLGTNALFSGGTRVISNQVVMFGTYNPSTLLHDIAMIYLPTNVAFNNNIQPISLPTGIELFLTFEGQNGVAAGYGRTSDQQTGVPADTQLRHVSLRIVSTFFCQSYYGFQVTDWNICTDGLGGVGICGGDSGGPLVVTSGGRRVLVGVASFNLLNGCQSSFPSGFTRVTSYINFIQNNL